MEHWYFYLIIIVVILLLNARLMKSKNKKQNTYKYNKGVDNDKDKEIIVFPYKAVKVMTPTELDFYKQLKLNIPEQYILLSKVRLWDIIDTTETKNKYVYTNKIQSKHIDFLIIDKNGNSILAIELDDKSHESQKRQGRDFFINNALEASKIKLIRYKPTDNYDFKELKELIDIKQ